MKKISRILGGKSRRASPPKNVCPGGSERLGDGGLRGGKPEKAIDHTTLKNRYMGGLRGGKWP